jgi:hypothetical protein
MDPELARLVLVVVLLAAGLALILIILRSGGRRRAERLAPAFELGTGRVSGFLGSAIDGLYRGYSCRYQIQQASQYDRGGANLRLALSAPHQWTAEVSKPQTRMLARFGLLKDFEVGDVELDEHLRFAADDEGTLRALFGAETVRNAMRPLTESDNFESLRAREDRVDVRWSPRAPKLDEDPEALRVRLELVTALVLACGYPPTQPTASYR